MIEIILTVCAVSNPANCEEKYLQFVWDGSINQCMMAAQPYIAQWIGQHPEWVATKWSCDYPGHERRRINPTRPHEIQFGPNATPQGSSPTWMDLITFCAATSITETSFDTPLATTRYFSSGVNAPCQTRCPTSRYFRTL